MGLTRARALIDRTVRSRWNYWVVMACDAAGAVALLVIGLAGFDASAIGAAALVGAGWFAWSFLEYALHRFIMHGPPSISRVEHARHHADPTALISAPLLLVISVAFGVWALLRLVTPPGAAALFVAGMYGGYNIYAWMHHFEHQWEHVIARIGMLHRLERIHDVHHFRQNVNFGVTTTLWDHVFGTFAAASSGAARPSRARSGRSG
jgi:sterol desaturase/sphingolipid hydroxylase (fatty acid hydroxylase superfamily)